RLAMGRRPPNPFRSCRRRCRTKRKGRPTIGSIACTTRCTVRTFCVMRTRAAAPIAGRPESMARRSRTSRRTALWAVVGRTDGGTPQEDVSAGRRPTGAYPESGRQAATVGDSNDQGSCRANGCFAGLGADLRAGFAAGAVRLPPRAERSGRQERQVQGLLDSGHREVVDADLSGYFDGIPHGELMKSVARRISDGQMLALIKRWLESYR